MIYFSIVGFYDLNLVENDTNIITLSHLHQKVSRLTNTGKNSVFWPPSCTYDVMTYVTWQRQDDVPCAKMCLPFLVTDTMRRFLRLESSKKLQGKNSRGGGTHPLGVRGLGASALIVGVPADLYLIPYDPHPYPPYDPHQPPRPNGTLGGPLLFIVGQFEHWACVINKYMHCETKKLLPKNKLSKLMSWLAWIQSI